MLPAGFAVPQGIGLPVNSGIQETKVLLSKPGGDPIVANRGVTLLSCTGLIALQSLLYCALLVTEIVVLERTEIDLPDNEAYKWMFRSSIWGTATSTSFGSFSRALLTSMPPHAPCNVLN